MQQSKAQLKDVLQNPFGRDTHPEGKDAPPQLEGAARDQQAAAERAARDEARAPYLAPDRAPLGFARLATRGKTQAEEVAAYLASSGLAARPDLVYGVYRVPDRISPTNMRKEKSSVVEWDIVHAATETLAPAARARPRWRASARARRGSRARSASRPCSTRTSRWPTSRYAGIAPEQCLGHRPPPRDRPAQRRRGQRQLDDQPGHGRPRLPRRRPRRRRLRADGRRQAADARGRDAGRLPRRAAQLGRDRPAVHPQSQKRFMVPSPFPHLPSTPQELLRAYLEIVGIKPADCYSAQVTEGPARDIQGKGKKGFMSFSTNVGEEQPCADGKDRRRLTGGCADRRRLPRRRRLRAGPRALGALPGRGPARPTSRPASGVRRPVEDRDWVDKLPGGLRGLTKTAGRDRGVRRRRRQRPPGRRSRHTATAGRRRSGERTRRPARRLRRHRRPQRARAPPPQPAVAGAVRLCSPARASPASSRSCCR